MTRSAQQTYIQRLGFQDKDRSNQRHGLACEYLLERLVQQQFLNGLQQRANDALDSYLRKVSASNANYVTRRDRANESGERWKEQKDNKEFSSYSPAQIQQYLDEAKQDYQDACEGINRTYQHHSAVSQFRGALEIAELEKEVRAKVPASTHINVPIQNGNYVNGFADVLFDKELCIEIEQVEIINGAPKPLWDVASWSSHNNGILGEVKITPEPAENVIQQIAFYRTYLQSVERVVILVDYDAPELKRLTKNSDIEVYRLGQKFEEWFAAREQPSVEEF